MQEFDRLFGLKRYIYHIICMTVPLKSSGNQCGYSCMFPLLAAGEADVLNSKIPFIFLVKPTYVESLKISWTRSEL